MSINIKEAFINPFRDKNFIQKYSVLLILSFCCGILGFAIIAHNYSYIKPILILAILAAVTNLGYDLEYIKSLIKNENTELPEWKDFFKYMLSGSKFSLAIILLVSVCVGIVLGLFILFGIFIYKKTLLLVLAAHIALGILTVIEIIMVFASMSYIYVYIDSNDDIFSVFNVKKVFSNFSANYFTALFASLTFTLINGLLGSIAMINIKYALFYIIPLIITPIIKLVSDNLAAQAYLRNKNFESGSVIKTVIFGFTCGVLFLTYFTINLLSNIPTK